MTHTICISFLNTIEHHDSLVDLEQEFGKLAIKVHEKKQLENGGILWIVDCQSQQEKDKILHNLSILQSNLAIKLKIKSSFNSQQNTKRQSEQPIEIIEEKIHKMSKAQQLTDEKREVQKDKEAQNSFEELSESSEGFEMLGNGDSVLEGQEFKRIENNNEIKADEQAQQKILTILGQETKGLDRPLSDQEEHIVQSQVKQQSVAQIKIQQQDKNQQSNIPSKRTENIHQIEQQQITDDKMYMERQETFQQQKTIEENVKQSVVSSETLQYVVELSNFVAQIIKQESQLKELQNKKQIVPSKAENVEEQNKIQQKQEIWIKLSQQKIQPQQEGLQKQRQEQIKFRIKFDWLDKEEKEEQSQNIKQQNLNQGDQVQTDKLDKIQNIIIDSIHQAQKSQNISQSLEIINQQFISSLELSSSDQIQRQRVKLKHDQQKQQNPSRIQQQPKQEPQNKTETPLHSHTSIISNKQYVNEECNQQKEPLLYTIVKNKALLKMKQTESAIQIPSPKQTQEESQILYQNINYIQHSRESQMQVQSVSVPATLSESKNKSSTITKNKQRKSSLKKNIHIDHQTNSPTQNNNQRYIIVLLLTAVLVFMCFLFYL